MDFNLAEVSEAFAGRFGDRDAIVSGRGLLSWAELTSRTRRLANFLLEAGLGAHAERNQLADYESGQDRVAVCLLNGPEYLEVMLGAFKARCAPCNVNYRYVASELEELLRDMAPRAVVFQSRFAPQLIEALGSAGLSPLLIQVLDSPGDALVPGAFEFESTLAAARDDPPRVAWSPDDLYVLYTGGTTGRPKGVLWRQADVFVTALGGRNYREGAREWVSLDEMVEAAAGRQGSRGLSAAPFMHGTGQWVSFQVLHTGGCVVVPSVVDRYDAPDVLDTIERERVNLLTIAGEAFASPLLEAIDAKERDLSSLLVVSSSGAALSPKSKVALLARLPWIRIRDTVGSSEAGPMADAIGNTRRHAGSAADEPQSLVTGPGPSPQGNTPVRFLANEDTCVVDELQTAILEADHEGAGWLARGGRIPLGYMNDPEKTSRTFKTIAGRRLTIPGDRARVHADGTVEVLGRDAVTINSGGEKIFAEEVEAAARHHAGVRDVAVVGRPSERWGSEVVALVEAEPGVAIDQASVVHACSAVLARYKLPKAVIFVDQVVRNPAGKLNYDWAKSVAAASLAGEFH
jgi:acyl-CoA synthetase (AMP-forming)/AMP-acid ligase II